MASALAVVALLLAAGGAWAAPPGFDAGPRCGDRPEVTCVPVALHLAPGERGPAAEPAWLARQLAEANRHFAESDIAFEVQSWHALPAEDARMKVAADRDRVGHGRAEEGRVDVFVVRHLADIDVEGEIIRGVHWRHRGTGQRWIVLADYAGDVVLAHELGHWFGLPHSRHPASIMNKRRDPSRPPPEARSFTPRERKRMARSLREQLRAGAVRPISAPQADSSERTLDGGARRGEGSADPGAPAGAPTGR